MDLATLVAFLKAEGLQLRHVRFADGFEVTVEARPEVDAAPAAKGPADADEELDALERFVGRRSVPRG